MSQDEHWRHRSNWLASRITTSGRCRSVGRRIWRIRWLLEGPLHRRAHRDIQIDALRRDRLGEPFVVERRKLGTLIEACGRGIGNSFEPVSSLRSMIPYGSGLE